MDALSLHAFFLSNSTIESMFLDIAILTLILPLMVLRNAISL